GPGVGECREGQASSQRDRERVAGRSGHARAPSGHGLAVWRANDPGARPLRGWRACVMVAVVHRRGHGNVQGLSCPHLPRASSLTRLPTSITLTTTCRGPSWANGPPPFPEGGNPCPAHV